MAEKSNQTSTIEWNKEIIRRYWDGKWNKRQPSILDELQTPGVLYHSPLEEMKGIEEYKRSYDGYKTALHNTSVVIEEMVAEGDKVVTRVRLSGLNKGALGDMPPSGNSFSCIVYTVFRLVNGRIAEEWELLDEATFMRQLGASK